MIKEMLADAWPVIEKVAPVLAQALGGPIIGSAVTALGILARKFNATNWETMLQAITSDPDAESKLQEIDGEFAQSLSQAAVVSIGKLASLKANVELTWKD